MKIFEYIDRISLMHKLISEHRTGSPDDFAVRLGIKRARLYELVDELKSYGAPILYSKSERSFYYEQPYDIRLICIMQPMNKKEYIESNGGNFFPSSIFYGRNYPTLAFVTLQC
ncbi:MAG: hypothetical protein EHM93_04055 [Bacteroidales bacterium]|nr:MAG: hypothetical protein EHM93_04055 [Bacteroidales bacterium]